MRFRPGHLRPHGWTPPHAVRISDWWGCTTEYLPVPVGNGWWRLVPMWEPGLLLNPLRRYELAELR